MLTFRRRDWRRWREVSWTIDGDIVDHGWLTLSGLGHVNHKAVLLDMLILIRKL